MNDLDAWIGRTTTARAWLDPRHANHLAVTLDREPDLAEGDPLPPAWHWIFFHDLIRASDLGQDGHPKLGIVMPPVGLPRRLWAGGTLRFESPLLLGSTVERVSSIRSITTREGRSGSLCFVTLDHEIRTGGVRNLVEEQDIVYRELPRGPETRHADPAPSDADFTTRHVPDSTTLFRYSAVTFNSHRIHYDPDYCRDVEGYPNLVVHGPLIATLLLDLAVRHERPLGRVTYRARSPLFLPHPFSTNGATDGVRTRLWVADHEGRLTMDAEAGPA
jgi:3-methylfumaryl-CoA hydratase